MANIKITIGAVNVPNYLIAIACKTTAPTVEVVREVYPPGVLDDSLNVILPSVGSIDAGVYYISWYESTDGVTLGQLLGKSSFDVRNQVQLSETRFYFTGAGRTNTGGLVIDPEVGSSTFTDPYLDGKNITKVIKESPIRPLVPPGGETEDFKEYDVSNGTITLLNGYTFGDSEIVCVEITYAFAYED